VREAVPCCGRWRRLPAFGNDHRHAAHSGRRSGIDAGAPRTGAGHSAPSGSAGRVCGQGRCFTALVDLGDGFLHVRIALQEATGEKRRPDPVAASCSAWLLPSPFVQRWLRPRWLGQLRETLEGALVAPGSGLGPGIPGGLPVVWPVNLGIAG